MKFKAEKNVLYEAVSSAAKACALKSALNILDGVLLSLDGDTLTVTGYDLEIGIKISVKVEGGEDGEIVTDPRLLSEMVRKMPGDTVDFMIKGDKEIKITSGKSVLSLPFKSGGDFPNIIEIKKDMSFDISEKLLKEMLTRVEFSASKNDSNPSLTGIKIEIEDKVFYSVATDGNRLAAKHCKIETENVDFIIPEKAVSSLVKNLSDDEEKENPKTVNISIDKNQVCVSKENYMIISRLLDGKFVNYKRIIESPYPKVITVKVRELASSMERCLLLISEKLKSPVTCYFNEDSVKISCRTALGAIDEEIDISVKEGYLSGFSVCFNPRFMFEALQKTYCDEIKICLDSNLKPFKITPLDDDGEFIFIIVPIRSG
ncbi:MAG: DNA polymerase III subunit beta [Oscillospiraceae bacterium]|jgi:DNA polymerase-3 subunit beta|nr:DNA polymerase III subunit beta [Oscillospiraceae bacterium]